MSYTVRTIGQRTVIQEDRIILVDAGSPAPTPATGYAMLKIETVQNKDVYLEYRIVDGPIQ